MSKTVVVGSLVGAVLLGGCDRMLNCTTEARSSVSVTVRDEAGAVLSDADVSYTVDGGEPADCEGFGSGGYVCGWEQEGTFEITIRALGFAVDTFTVQVGADECHVISEAVERTLTPADCTDEALPAVRVFVTDSQRAHIEAATLLWSIPDAELAPQDCFHLGGNAWACAEERYGDVEITVSDAGPYEPFSAIVEVEHDGCHPITETLDPVLQYLPD